ncbi:hypothetical protein [Actinoplanes awajinensis]|uniref:Uncharacterized protein n=1 Tax=Actinoplanes awajinensis subsp. mycoplanecinus TaxID=135947 RepID=A0A101JLN9_9ACTN|nr:hypothetical protein [Actinoplanes awajinensis]KUL29195.1 hypothetical protein ADL15_28970 [Actinoplanes awajinensis subsp. mycoplanecinus]
MAIKSKKPGSIRSRKVKFSPAKPAVEVTELSDDEWRAAARLGLQRLGLTFDELAQQAASRRFETPEALKFWRVLGGERP